jgi:hypothetical protein
MSEPLPDFPVSTPRFEVEPYRVERDYTLYALLVCLGGMSAVGLGAGYGAGWLCDLAPKFEWLLLLAVAAVLGGTGWVLVGQTRLRHGGVSALIALIAAALALGGVYYGSYLRALPQWDEEARRWVPYRAFAQVQPRAAHAKARHKTIGKELPEKLLLRLENTLVALPAAEQQRLAKFLGKDVEPILANPGNHRAAADWKAPAEATPIPTDQLGNELSIALRETLTGFSFGDYLDWKATRGVKMWIPRIKTVHFGYTGSVIYWCVGALVVFVVPWGAMCIRAEEPLCLQCHRWKTKRPVGRLNLPEEQLVQTFKEGTIVQLASEAVTTEGQPGGTVRVKLAVCDECRDTSDVQVILERITQDKAGADVFADIVKLTYPGQSLKVLESLFNPNLAPPPAEAPPAES